MEKLTSANGRYEVVMQSDGNLVIYRNGTPTWQSGTAEPQPPDPPVPPDPPSPPVQGRTGRTRIHARSMVDDGGPWLPVGTTLFWAVREANTPHLTDNLGFAAGHGCDFIRALCDTTDWPPETRIDPRQPGWIDAVRAVRDAARAAGLRVWWSIFGGNALTPQEQMRTVEDLLVTCHERPDAVMGIEISNESQGFLDADGPRRMRGFAEVFARQGYPTALTSAAHGNDGLYAGSAATIATEHFDRRLDEGGWRPVRQPWGYWERQAAPPTFSNNEPVGIGSSVAADSDPLRLACAAVVTWIAGGAVHVVHTGAGIYGVPMTHPVGGYRPANLSEQPTLAPTLDAISRMRSLLPPDLPSWSRQNHHWAGHPLTFHHPVGDPALAINHGCVRAYAATRGNDWVCLPIGLMRGTQPDGQPGVVEMDLKQSGTWTAYDPLTGDIGFIGNGRITLQAERLLIGRTS